MNARAIDWEAEYNVRLRHPERHEVQRQCLALSEQVYRDRACLRDLRYGDGARALIDFFPPSPQARHAEVPVVAFFHGGYWHSHHRAEFALVADPFVAAGMAVALVGYDLAPEADLASIVEQARSACRWLHARAGVLGFDARLMFAAGHSAGAHLAACALTMPRTPVRGALLISGIFDVDPIRRTSLLQAIGDLGPDAARRLSPLMHAFPPSGDVLVAVGGAETAQFLLQSRRFVQAWRADGRGAELMVVPRLNHYDIVLALGQRSSPLASACIEQVRRSAMKPTGCDPLPL